MTRRAFLATAAAFAAARKQPNIVLILADDLGYGDLSPEVTPNIHRLAQGGLRFTDFHSNGAVCSPTRAALMTGRYQQRAGIAEVIKAADDRDKGLATTEATLPKLLRKAGYHTGMFGKWHLGYRPEFNPVHHGFDEFRGYVSGNVDYLSHVDQAGYADWWNGDKLEPEEGYVTSLITKHGARFIEQNKGRPFFLYLAHEATHSPFQGPADKPFRVVGKNIQQPKGDFKAAFREMLRALDQSVADIAEAVKKAGLERDTLIFFTSDNGAPANMGSNGPLRGHKGSVWEGGHRVYTFAYWPDTVKPGETDGTAMTFDLFPTFAEIAGAGKPERKLDGISLLPHILKRSPLPERPLFWAFGPQQRGMRQGRWKLVVQPNGAPVLTDLREDIGEKNDLASAQPARVEAMKKAITAWEKDVQS